MKRIWIAAFVIILVAVLGIVSVVGAQNPTPGTPGQGFGRGMMGGEYGQGSMHDYMEKIVAEKLDMTVEALEAQHADGKSFWQIAEEKGLTVEQAQQLMTDARSQALESMVKDDVISQDQADWMNSRMGGSTGGGRGGCMGGRW